MQPQSHDSASPAARGLIGIAIELVGISVCLAGLATGGMIFTSAGIAYVPNAGVTVLGVLLTLIGLMVHIFATVPFQTSPELQALKPGREPP